MYIGMRWATANNAGEAVGVATKVAAYLRESYDWRIVAAMGLTGPSGKIGFLSINDSLGELLDRRTKVASDAGLAEIVGDSGGAFVPGSAVDYVLNVVHGEPDGGSDGGDLLFFRAIGYHGMLTPEIMANAVQSAEHLESAHGLKVNVSSSVGGDGAGLLFSSRHESGDNIHAIGEALAADEEFAAMSTANMDQVTQIRDRIVRMLP